MKNGKVYCVGRMKKADVIRGDAKTVKKVMDLSDIIVREGKTMSGIVEKLAEQYDWSGSVPNFSDKLRRGSLRYREAVELADALGYDLIWQKRKGAR